MRRSRFLAALIVVQAVIVTPCAAATLASRFDGRWKNESGNASLRWLDLHILENSGPAVMAWWSCPAPGGCMYAGPLNTGGDAHLNLVHHEQQWKSTLRIGEAQQGVLFVREEISHVDGRTQELTHRFRRASEPPAVTHANAVETRNGRIVVRTPDRRTFVIQPPNPANGPAPVTASNDQCRIEQGCREETLEVQTLQPPYNPNDPNLTWMARYNELLWQILTHLVRPDILEEIARNETDNQYERFVRRTALLNYVTER